MPVQGGIGTALDRQHMAGHLVEPLGEGLAQALALQRVFKAGIEGVDVGRQAPLAPQVVPGVFKGGEYIFWVKLETRGEVLQKLRCVLLGGAIVDAFVGAPGRVAPHRFTVAPPEAGERPARQLFARIPLALAVMLESLRRVALLQAVEQFGAQAALGRAHGIGIPLRAIRVVDSHEGRLATHGQAHIIGFQLAVDLLAQGFDLLPLQVGVGQGYTRRFENPRHLHVMLEFHLALVGGTGDRRGIAGVGCCGQRNVPFAGEQPRGRVEPDPAGARQIHLAPGMQIGEIDLGARGSVKRFHIRSKLDQVARDEARCYAQVAHDLHQQPG